MTTSKKKKTILVTGGAGFIGSTIVDRLVSKGENVVVLDNLSTGEKKYINKNAQFIKGDITDTKKLHSVFKKYNFDAVLHIAGSASTINSFANPYSDIDTNFIGTVNVVLLCLKYKVTRLLYASSMTVYGTPQKLPIQETHPCAPISYYGIGKYAAERFVLATSQRKDLPNKIDVTAFRMFNVYGPRQSLANPYQGVMAIFIGNVLRNEPIIIFGDGKQARDFIHVEDVASAWISSIDNKKSFNEVINLGYGYKTSINTLVKTIVKTCNKNPKTYPILYKAQRPGDQRFMQADIKRAQKLLGFKPKYSLAVGLSKTLAWAKEEML